MNFILLVNYNVLMFYGNNYIGMLNIVWLFE